MNTLQKSYTLNNKKPAPALVVLAALVLLFILCVLSFSFGATGISGFELWGVVTGKASEVTLQKIQLVRLPRTVAAMLAGAGLAVSGLILQIVLRNPLSSPNIIGVNAGAALFVVAGAALFPAKIASLSPVLAFAGALLAVFLVFSIANYTGASNKMVLLAGIAVNSIVAAFTDTITTLDSGLKLIRADFMIGSFSAVSLSSVLSAAPYILVAFIVAALFRQELRLMLLSDDTAVSLGMNLRLMRIIFLSCAALLAGASVSIAGLIGFVGLIVPHLVKQAVGGDSPLLLPLTALGGACLCLACDILARTLFAPYEIPVGILLSLIGAPFFLWLVFRRKREAGR